MVQSFESGSNVEILPEDLQPNVYSRREVEPVRLGAMIMLSQVRSGTNPVVEKLGESIASGDLEHPPHIARMSQPKLEEYINFTNEIWGAEQVADDFNPEQDGYYYLVISGHSRVKAMWNIEKSKAERAREFGHVTDPGSAIINNCPIHHDPTPEEIIASQLAENIHHQVPRERQAMSIVETYLYGLKTGQWENQEEFRKYANDKFTKNELSQALRFAELPINIREHVLSGNFPYLGAVELAKTRSVYRKLQVHLYYGGRELEELNDEEMHLLAKDEQLWLGMEVALAQNKRLNGTALQKRYRSYRTSFRSKMSETIASSDQCLTLSDPLQDHKLRLRKIEQDYNRALEELAEAPLQSALHAVGLHQELLRHQNSLELDTLGVIEQRSRRYIEGLGEIAAQQQRTAL